MDGHGDPGTEEEQTAIGRKFYRPTVAVLGGVLPGRVQQARLRCMGKTDRIQCLLENRTKDALHP